MVKVGQDLARFTFKLITAEAKVAVVEEKATWSEEQHSSL